MADNEQPILRTHRTPTGEVVCLHCNRCKRAIMPLRGHHKILRDRTYTCHACNPEIVEHRAIYGPFPKDRGSSLPI